MVNGILYRSLVKGENTSSNSSDIQNANQAPFGVPLLPPPTHHIWSRGKSMGTVSKLRDISFPVVEIDFDGQLGENSSTRLGSPCDRFPDPDPGMKLTSRLRTCTCAQFQHLGFGTCPDPRQYTVVNMVVGCPFPTRAEIEPKFVQEVNVAVGMGHSHESTSFD